MLILVRLSLRFYKGCVLAKKKTTRQTFLWEAVKFAKLQTFKMSIGKLPILV